MEETGVNGFEDLFKIVVPALRGADPLASPRLPDALGLARHRFRLRVPAVAVGVGGRDRFAVQLGEQNVCDGAMNALRGMLQQIGEPHDELAFAKPDGGVETGEAPKPDFDGRHGRPRPQGTVLLVKEGDQGRTGSGQGRRRHASTA